MEETVSIDIHIGGELSKEYLAEFVEVINGRNFVPQIRVEDFHNLLKENNNFHKNNFRYSTRAKIHSSNYSTLEGIEKFCAMHNLSYSKYIPPHSYNASIWLWRPGFLEPQVIPVNQDYEPVCVLDDAYTVLHLIADFYENTPDSDLPLYVNQSILSGEIARLRLSGAPLSKIIKTILDSEVGYPELTIPPLVII